MMKTNILLISEKTLKSVGLINDNVDNCYLQPAQVLAQEIGLQEIIGTKLLNKIKNLVQTGEINNEENANYKTLLDDYCTDFLIWQTTAELQIPISMKTANSGSVQNNDDHKNANIIENIQYMKEYYQDKARFFAKRLSDYLLVNANKYPEWPGNFKDGIIGLTENYSGVYFRDSIYDKLHYGYDKKY